MDKPGRDVLIAIQNEQWILSNFASQKTLLRTLYGLSAKPLEQEYNMQMYVNLAYF